MKKMKKDFGKYEELTQNFVTTSSKELIIDHIVELRETIEEYDNLQKEMLDCFKYISETTLSPVIKANCEDMIKKIGENK